MIAFIEKLNSEVLRSIERIESRDTDVLKKSLEASRVLGEAFDRLKQYIIGYRFQNDDEEIKFFKEIKPRLFCRLIYYRKLYINPEKRNEPSCKNEVVQNLQKRSVQKSTSAQYKKSTEKTYFFGAFLLLCLLAISPKITNFKQ